MGRRADLDLAAGRQPLTERLFVVVSGPPASGKSTLAAALAQRLRLPLVAKDTIKEALLAALDVPDVAASLRVGHAAILAMLAVAAQSPTGAILESPFRRSVAASELARLPGTVIEVFCRCDRDVALQRYLARAQAGERHPGHFDKARAAADVWNDEVAEPVAGGWPVLQADTNHPVDIDRSWRSSAVQSSRSERSSPSTSAISPTARPAQSTSGS